MCSRISEAITESKLPIQRTVRYDVVYIRLGQVAECELPEDARDDEPDPVHVLLLALTHSLVLRLNEGPQEEVEGLMSEGVVA